MVLHVCYTVTKNRRKRMPEEMVAVAVKVFLWAFLFCLLAENAIQPFSISEISRKVCCGNSGSYGIICSSKVLINVTLLQIFSLPTHKSVIQNRSVTPAHTHMLCISKRSNCGLVVWVICDINSDSKFYTDVLYFSIQGLSGGWSRRSAGK